MSRGHRDSPAASGQVAAQQRGTSPGSLRRLLGRWPGEAGGGWGGFLEEQVDRF